MSLHMSSLLQVMYVSSIAYFFFTSSTS